MYCTYKGVVVEHSRLFDTTDCPALARMTRSSPRSPIKLIGAVTKSALLLPVLWTYAEAKAYIDHALLAGKVPAKEKRGEENTGVQPTTQQTRAHVQRRQRRTE